MLGDELVEEEFGHFVSDSYCEVKGGEEGFVSIMGVLEGAFGLGIESRVPNCVRELEEVDGDTHTCIFPRIKKIYVNLSRFIREVVREFLARLDLGRG